ncbi:TPA: hypothetical protein DF272_01705 [Candidatus Falkowbacteria bacterium]|nr:hypothetical protein [Candidatus Falkowbacteria bacterium]
MPIVESDNFNQVQAYVLGNPIRHGLLTAYDDLKHYKYCNFDKWIEINTDEGMKFQVLSQLRLKVNSEDEEKFWRRELNVR